MFNGREGVCWATKRSMEEKRSCQVYQLFLWNVLLFGGDHIHVISRVRLPNGLMLGPKWPGQVSAVPEGLLSFLSSVFEFLELRKTNAPTHRTSQRNGMAEPLCRFAALECSVQVEED